MMMTANPGKPESVLGGKEVDWSLSTLRKVRTMSEEKHFRFVPRDDITVMDLAELFEAMMDAFKMTVTEGFFEKIDEKHRRHFMPVIEEPKKPKFSVISSIKKSLL